MGVRIPVTILVLLAAAVGQAQAQTVDGIEQAWRGWATQYGRKTSGLAVVHGGRVVREAAMGQERVGEPVPVASLSKAVTGVCVAGLIDRGQLSFETPLSQALAKTMARVGRPVDPRLSAVTISQLLVHRAGIAKQDVANAPLADYLRTQTARRTAFDVQLGWIFRHRLAADPGTRYVYSNAGYLILGAVIEEASGRDYEGYCRDTVLLPLGARTAELNPAWRIMSSYGGWRMSTADYARFYQAFAPGNPAIGPQARAWMMSPEGKRVGGGGVHYGLGTFVRPTPTGGGTFWHWGAWTYNLRGAYDGTLNASYSAFAVRLGAIDANMVVHIEPNLGKGGGQGVLDRTLRGAAEAVRNWP
ncbi:MAG: beta-lactamase family protein [Reyranella sp.]|nr:beta-lactamase family protein [Reyranella sp.]